MKKVSSLLILMFSVAVGAETLTCPRQSSLHLNPETMKWEADPVQIQNAHLLWEENVLYSPSTREQIAVEIEARKSILGRVNSSLTENDSLYNEWVKEITPKFTSIFLSTEEKEIKCYYQVPRYDERIKLSLTIPEHVKFVPFSTKDIDHRLYEGQGWPWFSGDQNADPDNVIRDLTHMNESIYLQGVPVMVCIGDGHPELCPMRVQTKHSHSEL